MKNVRMSRVVHQVPREFMNTDTVCDETIRGKEYRDGVVLRDREGPGAFIVKSEPQYHYKKTRVPESNEKPSDGGKPGKPRSRQADKSSRVR